MLKNTQRPEMLVYLYYDLRHFGIAGYCKLAIAQPGWSGSGMDACCGQATCMGFAYI